MKNLELKQMENVQGGEELLPCGQAVVMGTILGGILGGGIGSIFGLATTALGPNCLGLW